MNEPSPEPRGAPRSVIDLLYVGMLPPHPGGSAISWAQLLAGFARRGHAVRALAPITADELAGGDGFHAAHPELELRRYLVPHHYTGPNVPASREYRELEGAAIRSGLERWIGERRPDLLLAGRESFALHVPEIAATHEIPLVQGIRGNTTLAIVEGSYPAELAEETLAGFRRADARIAAARHLAAGLARFDLATEVIPNAVDCRLFSPRARPEALAAELGLGKQEVVVLHASNLKSVKRPLDLVEAATQLEGDRARLRFLVAGDGRLREEMQAAALARGVAGQFRFLGWVDYPRMPELLSLADLVVSTSSAEGMSRIYLETFASGRLLVASDIPAARELILDGSTGLLFPAGDPAALAERIARAAGDAALRRAIGERARRAALERDLEGAVDRYLELFARLVAPR